MECLLSPRRNARINSFILIMSMERKVLRMTTQNIIIKNGKENNLKGINCEIPRGKLTIFTGVSGSGKSSLVFDTIAQEAGRQLNETYDAFTRRFLPRYRHPETDAIHNLSPTITIDQKRLGGNVRSTLGTVSDINPLFRLLFSRFSQPQVGSSNFFSFNDPAGMCPTCEGIGRTVAMDPNAALDMNKSLKEGAILLPGMGAGTYYCQQYCDSGFFDPEKKIKDYSDEEFDLLLNAETQKLRFLHPETNVEFNATFEGLAVRFARSYINTEKEVTKRSAKIMAQFSNEQTCRHCQGKRYNEAALNAKIADYSIFDLTHLQLDELLPQLAAITVAEPDAQPIVQSIIQKVQLLVDIGLGYMALTRETPTISGGESQRIKMVKHLSSNLTGMIYIFDEPSTGLHPRDVHHLNDLLIQIRDAGNTVLVVEHDPDVIKIADHIIDMGPLAGSQGGEIMFEGSFTELQQSKTLTGQYLQQKLPLNKQPREFTDTYTSTSSRLNNLKNISLTIPQGVFTAITGVSGSGKSTLVREVFAVDFPDAIYINQHALHTNSRSNPATYLGFMNDIRKIFAKANDVSDKLFSFNSEGACTNCKGKGIIELNLSFMDATEVECDVCQGTRYQAKVLAYTYKGYTIVDVMNMTMAEAYEQFETNKIRKQLKSLIEVGLDYLTLGQPLSTLSGGECQRIKLAIELNRKGNIFILDEPTTGLHLSNVETLLNIIHDLVDKGNTVIVIEHNTDVIRQADWIVDLGPDGGSRGGQIVFEGKLTDIKACEASVTAKYL